MVFLLFFFFFLFLFIAAFIISLYVNDHDLPFISLAAIQRIIEIPAFLHWSDSTHVILISLADVIGCRVFVDNDELDGDDHYKGELNRF